MPFFAIVVAAALTLPPPPTSYVADAAGVIEPARETALNEQLAAFERETSNQIVVYLDRALPADAASIEEFAAAAFREWGIGQKDRLNGALVLFLVDDRRMRIEVGYGLEGILTDARSSRIIGSIRPELRAGEYATAAEKAAAGIMTVVRGEYQGSGETVAERSDRSKALTILAWIGGLFALGLGIALIPLLVFSRKSPRRSTAEEKAELLAKISVVERDLQKASKQMFGSVLGSGDFRHEGSTSEAGSSWTFGGGSSSSSGSSSAFKGGGGQSGGGGASGSW